MSRDEITSSISSLPRIVRRGGFRTEGLPAGSPRARAKSLISPEERPSAFAALSASMEFRQKL
jgi:hypothetical protein